MKLSKWAFICACVVGLTLLVWSQGKGNGVFSGRGIPGYLDPRTGTFTTRIDTSGSQPKASYELTGTTILFREQFNITITNYDQSSSDSVSCSANISTSDPNARYYESAGSVATQSGNTYSCNLPILAQWTLQNPGSDSISACIYVDFYGYAAAYESSRYSEPPCLTLSVPSNAQTVTNAISVTL